MPVKPIRLAITLIMAAITSLCHAQSVIVQSNINLPKDSVTKNQLIGSLNGFLSQKETSNKENSYVLKENLLETSALLDVMKGVEQNVKLKDKNFYKGYLTNVIKVDNDDFLIQLSYIGINENSPVLRASFKLLAKRQGQQFYFYSPLKQNTIAWKIKKYNKLTCYYKDTLRAADAKAYQSTVDFYNKKLNAPNLPMKFYYCDSYNEVLQIIGVEYMADYNGFKDNLFTEEENNTELVLNGWNDVPHRFDPHDMWHDRLRMVMKSAIINRPVDEGCAYLYGGSWGYTWEEVLSKFKNYVAANQNADWLNLYLETTNFEGGDKPMKVGYVLNALIAQKLEREKGFGAVMELLGCGPREKGDENYFKALDKLTRINKGNFNAEMNKLVKGL